MKLTETIEAIEHFNDTHAIGQRVQFRRSPTSQWQVGTLASFASLSPVQTAVVKIAGMYGMTDLANVKNL